MPHTGSLRELRTKAWLDFLPEPSRQYEVPAIVKKIKINVLVLQLLGLLGRCIRTLFPEIDS